MKYLYVLGRTPELAFLELKTFLPDVSRLNATIATSDHLVPIDRLGGTVKIAEVTDTPAIAAKSTFGVSVYPGPQLSIKTLEEMKKTYGAARFVATHGAPLTSVVVEKNKLLEIIFVRDGSITAKTLAVQPFEAWNKRDFGRPFADPKSGMLPPKVARMVVNIAGIGKGKTLLDPFCGMGTILSEAMIMGWQVVGNDQSAEVVDKARANLDWLNLKGYQLFTSDATHVSAHIGPQSIDAIVTEPFMGKQANGVFQDTKNILRGLEKLYIGCLKDWQKVLRPKARVIMAFPEYHVGGRTYSVKKVIDSCEMLGYTTLAGPIEYSRPQARVRREFYIFQKKSNF